MLVSFGGMVVDHIENHLDASAVQRLHHGTKLIEAAERIVLVGAIRQMRSKERDRIVAPVINEPRRCVRCIELIDRQQLHGSNAKVL